MNEVLIVTYFFADGLTAAGLRPLGLAKYLPEFGWKPLVLTALLPREQDPRYEVINTGTFDSLGRMKKLFGINPRLTLTAQIAQLKKKLGIKSEKSILDTALAALGEITAYPDLQKGWRRLAVRSGKEIFSSHDIKAMISMSPPATAHIIARELQPVYKVPWVADFRDLWTQNYYYPFSPVRRSIERRLERKTLSSADALITVSEPAAVDLRNLHIEKSVQSIPNGFDPNELNDNTVPLTLKFTITYTGNIYPGKQSPELLFSALQSLISQKEMKKSDIEVRFYGTYVEWIDELAGRYGLSEIVQQYGLVERAIALEKQRESQVLLLLKWNDPRYRGVYTAKIFEYLAAGRPILAIGGYEDVVSELLDETQAGMSADTQDQLRKVILEYYSEYRQTGMISYHGNDAMIGKYSHREMARKFADVLESIT